MLGSCFEKHSQSRFHFSRRTVPPHLCVREWQSSKLKALFLENCSSSQPFFENAATLTNYYCYWYYYFYYQGTDLRFESNGSRTQYLFSPYSTHYSTATIFSVINTSYILYIHHPNFLFVNNVPNIVHYLLTGTTVL